MISTYGDNDRLTADRIYHKLDDDREVELPQASLRIGHHRLAVSLHASDDEVFASLLAIEKLIAEAAFMASDLRGLLERRERERTSDEDAAHKQHAEPAPDDAQAVVDAWNAAHPEGTPVRYWAGTREHASQTSYTRSAAELLGGHTPVVWLTGEVSCIALTHVEPIAEPAPDDDDPGVIAPCSRVGDRVKHLPHCGGDFWCEGLGDDDVLVAGGEIEIIELTPEEYEAALANDLARLGCTYEQLVEMARTGDYASPDHRQMWLRIKPLPDVLTEACARWTVHEEHEPHFWGDGLRCPGWSADDAESEA